MSECSKRCVLCELGALFCQRVLNGPQRLLNVLAAPAKDTCGRQMRQTDREKERERARERGSELCLWVRYATVTHVSHTEICGANLLVQATCDNRAMCLDGGAQFVTINTSRVAYRSECVGAQRVPHRHSVQSNSSNASAECVCDLFVIAKALFGAAMRQISRQCHVERDDERHSGLQ